MLFLLCLVSAPHLQAQKADTIVSNVVVETVDPRYPSAQAVAVLNDRILAVGSIGKILEHRGEKTRMIDGQGSLLIPGFIESHGHFAGIGSALHSVDLVGCKSYDALVSIVKAAAEKLPGGSWITGRGWDQNLWEQKVFPVHDRLSKAVPDHPVWVRRVDGHAALANAKAMKMAGFSGESRAMRGGEVIRTKEGSPTGVFVDRAMAHISRAVPGKTRATLERDLLAAQELCFREGITSFQDAGTSRGMVDVYSKLLTAKKLKIRLWIMLGGSGARSVGRDAKIPPIIGTHENRLTVRAFKLGIDGALGSRGAALLEDYSDRPKHRGLLMIGPEELARIGDAALEGGYQVCVHAIGDGGNRAVLDAWETLFSEKPEGREARFRIEHAQILDAADIPRFARLGIIASMQGIHCSSDMSWVPTRIGRSRTLEGAYVWRKLLNQGVVICNGTDAPVEGVSAIASYYASVTRQDPTGNPPGGWQPDQRMTRREALHTYTMGAAYAGFEENIKGSITPGKLADFILLDRNILTCPAREILKTRVLMTFVGGELVHVAR